MLLTTQNPAPSTQHPGPKPKALVLYGYGLNCDWETQFALNKAGAEAFRVHTSDLLANPAMLWDYHLLAVPGGFSWGDEHGAGVILALRLKLALGQALQEFVQAGRLVIAICNGFQILVNLGLLPNLPGRTGERLVALIPNDCGNFRDAWVHLKVNPDSPCVFTRGLDLFELPVRHGEGKFYADPGVLSTLENNWQIALQYALRRPGRRPLPREPQRLGFRHCRHLRCHRPGFGPHAPPGSTHHPFSAPCLDP
jgi:phosphoribosylformylglycinamidine synthase subunit PurQ / glutaminase